MYKKMMPALIGAALMGSVGSVVADVTLFGHLDTSWVATDVDGGSDDVNLKCTTCSIGFKGSEDLGNGLKAIFKLDFEFDTINRNSNGAITDRDQWLGLAGGFGKVRVGTISTVYKSHGAMIDPLYRTSLQGRDRGLQSSLHSSAGDELQGRATNTVRWDSADFNGVQLGAFYTLDATEADLEDEDPYGIGISYESGAILVFADYMDNGQSGSGEKDAWKVGGKYTLGMFAFMGQYEEYQNSSSDEEWVWHVAGQAGPLFGIKAYLGFGKGKDQATIQDYKAWTFALMHDMSKRTMVYTGFSQVDCDNNAISACSALTSSGGEDDRFSLGLKHKF